jgi:lipoprotein-releasing system permease protein
MSILKNLPFEWLVGLRYTRAGKRSGRNSFISFISLISMAGIGLGVAALIVVLSVMNGFQKEVTDRMLSVLAHVEIFDARGSMPDWQQEAAEARKNPEVIGTAPFAETQGMLVRDDAAPGHRARRAAGGRAESVRRGQPDQAWQLQRAAAGRLQHRAGHRAGAHLRVNLGEK